MTFTDLRRAMRKPTADQIAAAFRAELVFLANEHAPRDVTAPWWGMERSAADAALDAAIALRPAGPFRDLLQLVLDAERAENRAGWGIDPEAFADAAQAIVDEARKYDAEAA